MKTLVEAPQVSVRSRTLQTGLLGLWSEVSLERVSGVPQGVLNTPRKVYGVLLSLLGGIFTVFRMALVLAVIGLVGTTHGQSRYNVTHSFSLRPGGNMLPVVDWHWSVFAFARDPGGVRQDGPRSGITAVPPAGLVDSRTALAVVTYADARGESRVSVNPFGVGSPVTGTINANGEANASPPPRGTSSARAASSSQVVAQGRTRDPRGRIRWGPRVRSRAVAGGTGRVSDPIYIEVMDLNGNPLSGRLKILDITWNHGPGEVGWDDTTNQLTFSGSSDADFLIDIPGDYTDLAGSVRLTIRDGVITESEDSGIFDGLFPSVGQPGNFAVTMPILDMQYDLSSFFGDPNNPEERELRFTLEGGGEASAFAIPEPNSLLALGIGVVPLLVRRMRRSEPVRSSDDSAR